MWESILIATVPAIITLIVTNAYNTSRHKAEVQKIIQESKNSESDNMKTILETYNNTLTQYKTELEDVNKRFTNYITEANKRATASRERMANLEKSNKELQSKLDKLTTIIKSDGKLAQKYKNIDEN